MGSLIVIYVSEISLISDASSTKTTSSIELIVCSNIWSATWTEEVPEVTSMAGSIVIFWWNSMSTGSKATYVVNLLRTESTISS